MNKRELVPWIVLCVLTVAYVVVLTLVIRADKPISYRECQRMYEECEIACPDDEENGDG
ncbi:MAG: hypothetical protein GY715_14165 [Planctomycetes bacterium]|nr:hypothetical protein [Planctomycetota bacterium]